MKNRKWLSLALAAVLLLSSVPVLSADEGARAWIFYRDQEDTEGKSPIICQIIQEKARLSP